jgi:hypothetical protein
LNVKNQISINIEVIGDENGVVIGLECGKNGKSVKKKKEILPP